MPSQAKTSRRKEAGVEVVLKVAGSGFLLNNAVAMMTWLELATTPYL
jgi:hypothetical protein